MILVSISLVVLLTSLVSSILTSLIASWLDGMQWHTKLKKTKFSKVNYLLSSFYQFNSKFYNPFSFLREFMLSALITALIYKYLAYANCIFDLKCIFANFIIVIIIRILMQTIAYAKFFDRELVR